MPPDVTLNDILYWDPVAGAASYQVRVLDAINNPLDPPGVIDNALNTSIGIDQLLAGQPFPAQYKLQVQSLPNTNWSQFVVNYVGVGQPQNLRLTP